MGLKQLYQISCIAIFIINKILPVRATFIPSLELFTLLDPPRPSSSFRSRQSPGSHTYLYIIHPLNFQVYRGITFHYRSHHPHCHMLFHCHTPTCQFVTGVCLSVTLHIINLWRCPKYFNLISRNQINNLMVIVLQFIEVSRNCINMS